ncbi:unnamed protein product, partial [Phaeothamnion confervicola]
DSFKVRVAIPNWHCASLSDRAGKIFMPRNSLAAAAVHQRAKERVFGVASNMLDLQSGGARAEGITLLPPGDDWLALALLTFGLPAAGLNHRLGAERVAAAADFHEACCVLDESVEPHPELVRRLHTLFGLVSDADAAAAARSAAAAAAGEEEEILYRGNRRRGRGGDDRVVGSGSVQRRAAGGGYALSAAAGPVAAAAAAPVRAPAPAATMRASASDRASPAPGSSAAVAATGLMGAGAAAARRGPRQAKKAAAATAAVVAAGAPFQARAQRPTARPDKPSRAAVSAAAAAAAEGYVLPSAAYYSVPPAAAPISLAELEAAIFAKSSPAAPPPVAAAPAAKVPRARKPEHLLAEQRAVAAATAFLKEANGAIIAVGAVDDAIFAAVGFRVGGPDGKRALGRATPIVSFLRRIPAVAVKKGRAYYLMVEHHQSSDAAVKGRGGAAINGGGSAAVNDGSADHGSISGSGGDHGGGGGRVGALPAVDSGGWANATNGAWKDDSGWVSPSAYANGGASGRDGNDDDTRNSRCSAPSLAALMLAVQRLLRLSAPYFVKEMSLIHEIASIKDPESGSWLALTPAAIKRATGSKQMSVATFLQSVPGVEKDGNKHKYRWCGNDAAAAAAPADDETFSLEGSAAAATVPASRSALATPASVTRGVHARSPVLVLPKRM